MGMMTQDGFQFYQMLQDDPRYPLEAYQFVQDALGYAQQLIDKDDPIVTQLQSDSESIDQDKHLTGQQLCYAVKNYAIDQFGLMAKVVLGTWGIHSTDAVGDIVYNLINIGCMKKSKQDRREHFDGVFDFEKEFERDFVFNPKVCAE